MKRATRSLTKHRPAHNRRDYGSEDDWIDLGHPICPVSVDEGEVDSLRLRQRAYLARYAPGYRYSEDIPAHELGAFVDAVSAIVKGENGK